jgi:type II secretory ATPase GspE/PulE/Tfp pilus assembly ATPase PilB-like protein
MRRLGELLLEKRLIKENQLEVALKVQTLTGERLGEVLVKLGFISSRDLAQCLAEQHGLPYIDLREIQGISEYLLKKFPKEVTQDAGFLPLEENHELHIVVTDPANLRAFEVAQAMSKKRVRVFLTDEEVFWDVFEKVYYFLENPTEKLVEEANRRARLEVPTELIPQLVEALISEGVRRHATHIHLMVTEPVLNVLYRVDGVLLYGFSLMRNLVFPIISRIKILAQMEIAETRIPQDGSFEFEFLGRKYGIRVSTLPTIQGESVVLRILFGTRSELYRLENLGFEKELIKELKLLMRKPHGMILCTGPTGSGKSTTLYALLNEVNRLERSVITIEDPVEYRLNFAKQSQINEKKAYDFTMAGRNFMRHDPDIIVIDEIRDEETAKTAIRASITGHLLLSTLHANDSLSVIPRFLDLGVDRFLLSTSLLGVLSQRLVRKICPICKDERKPTEAEKRLFEENGFDSNEIRSLYFGRGCSACKGLGYFGRTAIGELLSVNDTIRDMIYKGASFREFREAAQKAGTEPLKRDGIKKVLKGITTIEELERVLG